MKYINTLFRQARSAMATVFRIILIFGILFIIFSYLKKI